jgi:hypothetical protein
MKRLPNLKNRDILKYLIIAFLVIWAISSIYAKFLPSPEDISIEGNVYNISDEDIEFLYDLNYIKNNQTVIEQEIFEEVFKIINEAEKFIVIDMFLFNTDYSEKVRYKNLTTDMKNLLVKKKKEIPEIKIVFTTDEINNFYGDYVSEELLELKENNISVVITNNQKLRDINFIYAGFWRAYVQWFGTSGNGWIAHPLGKIEEKVTLRSYLKLMNTKANHRKVIVADSGERLVSIVTSANPHEASSKHSNVGVKIFDSVALDILRTEAGISSFSSKDETIKDIYENLELPKTEGEIKVQLLTEQKIRDGLLEEIKKTIEGEKIEMVMFYLSDRKIVKSLLSASERGVEIEIILDPNKDAFAREKSGIPNRQVAWELVKDSNHKIKIRWYDTKGEQQHSKITVIKKLNGKVIVFLGSANLTKRNIGDYNLEMNVKIITPLGTKFEKEIERFFSDLWINRTGHYTTEFEDYEDRSFGKYLLYRFQEATGLSSF